MEGLVKVYLNQRTNYSNTNQILTSCPKAPKLRITKDGREVEPLPVWVYCGNPECGRRRKIMPSCKRRNCPYCGRVRAKKLEDRYLPKILEIPNVPHHKWTFGTLTGFRFDVELSTLRAKIKRFMDVVEEFLSDEYEDAGIASMELVPKQELRPVAVVLPGEINGMEIDGEASLLGIQKLYYIHAHFVARGRFKIKEDFENRWQNRLIDAELITQGEVPPERLGRDARRWTWLELLKDDYGLKRRVGYTLKYVGKGLPITDEEEEVLRRSKYIRSWGMLYGMREPTMDLICGDCGAKCYVAFEEEYIPHPSRYPEQILKIRRVPREPTGPP
jgi:hypothetical protein